MHVSYRIILTDLSHGSDVVPHSWQLRLHPHLQVHVHQLVAEGGELVAEADLQRRHVMYTNLCYV